MSKTVVLVVRDPDYSNEFTTIDGDEPGVEIFDIDLGRSNLSACDEYDEWISSHEQDAVKLEAEGNPTAARAYRSIIRDCIDQPNGWDDYLEDAEAEDAGGSR